MINRLETSLLQQSLKKFPVVGILGPRQVGKTTLAKRILADHKPDVVYLDLELPSDITKLTDAELFLSPLNDRLVIIDEIQRMPSLFPLLRALVDQARRPGRFLILGSASPDMLRNASESLAGRIVYHELTSFQLKEIKNNESKKLWIQGGFPDSFLASGEDSFEWRQAFIQTYLERDLPQLGIRIPSLQLKRFWTMIAHYHGQLWNASRIAGSLGISPPTAARYLDILQNTFILRSLPPYHTNIRKRLVKSPKVYFRDTGLLHAILNLRDFDQLAAHPGIGSSWEGFVVEQILSMSAGRFSPYFYRTQVGAELDLVLESGRDRMSFEMKYSLSPQPTKGFWNALQDVDCRQAYIVYPGNETYTIAKNVQVVPLSKLDSILA